MTLLQALAVLALYPDYVSALAANRLTLYECAKEVVQRAVSEIDP